MSACDCAAPVVGRRPSDSVRLGILRAVGASMRWNRPGDASAARPPAPRILLIRPDHLGDLLLTSPAIGLLRKALPEAHLSMMVGPWSEEIARRDPLLDEVVVCRFPGFSRAAALAPWEPYRLLLSAASELSRHRYDAALVLRFDHWWGAWLSAAAGIPVRVGFATPESRPFLSHTIGVVDGMHWVNRSIGVVERLLQAWGMGDPAPGCLPGLRFGLGPDDDAGADRLCSDLGIPREARIVAFHPGAGSALKQWPAIRWSELGRRLSGVGTTVLVTGSASEAGLAERVAAGVPGAHSVAGQTGLGVLAALFRRCSLVAGVDNGPLHLAAAVDTTSVRLYGPTDAAVYGPWGDAARHRSIVSGIAASPCSRLDMSPLDGESPACLRSISVEQVEAICRELLGGSGR